jgi:hypothetical protein
MVGQKFVTVTGSGVRVGSVEAPETEVVINELPMLDGLESHVDGLLGQSFLAQHPYLIDLKRRRLWLGDEAVSKAQHLGPAMQVDFSFGRPILLVGVNPKGLRSRLILDSGVNHLVLRCADRCGTLIDERTGRAVTNAGEMPVQIGRIPVASVGSQKFFRPEAVLMKVSPDPNSIEGSVPLQWFSAVYIDAADRVARLSR